MLKEPKTLIFQEIPADLIKIKKTNYNRKILLYFKYSINVRKIFNVTT